MKMKHHLLESKSLFSLLRILVLLFPVSVYAQVNETQRRPNVILIYSDDQGWADLGVYGSPDLYTPNLDQLARKGVRFNQFYSASPVCSPSRAAVLTGRFPQRAGLPGNASSHLGEAGMPGHQYTLAEMFKDAGYRTGHVGKWHVGYDEETTPRAQGFDYSFGFMGGVIDNYSHFFYWDGPNRHDLWRNDQRLYRDGEYFPDLMVDEASTFLNQHQEEPFFLYFAINIPHYPLQPEKKWLDYYREKGVATPRDMYGAFVSTMDERIGMLLSELDRLGLTENTIVIFQADQGFSEEERTFGGGGSAGELRGSKFSLFEGGIRVPAIISWPEIIPADQVRDQFSANIDWFPTLAEYCEITLPKRKIDGKSLIGIIQGKESQSNHDVFYWKSGSRDGLPQWAIREGPWKLLHNPIQADQDELNADRFFLVNLDSDPSEQKNLSDSQPEVVARLKSLFERWEVEVEKK